MFWIGIVIATAIVVGGSVLVGTMLSRRARPRTGSRRDQQMNALKASGALRHRKSNQD